MTKAQGMSSQPPIKQPASVGARSTAGAALDIDAHLIGHSDCRPDEPYIAGRGKDPGEMSLISSALFFGFVET